MSKAKQTQARKDKKAGGGYADDDNKPAERPQRWSDYTVHFEFPEPSELPSTSLLQVLAHCHGQDLIICVSQGCLCLLNLTECPI